MNWRKGKRVAIIGAGPGGVSAALAMLQKGYDVKLFERQPQPKPLGGAVLLSVPVLAVLRHYGMDLDKFGSYTKVQFKNHKGNQRASLPFNNAVEKAFNIKGWHYGVLRSDAFGKMLSLLPHNIINADHGFTHYEENEDSVRVFFSNGEQIEADIIIGADGINSKVSEQAFGDPGLFHVGLRVWLAWCDDIEGIARDCGVLSHSDRYQASYFPMLHHGKPGFEWWIVEPQKEHADQPSDVRAYLQGILSEFNGPVSKLLAHTDIDKQVFCWDVYNRPSLQKWSKGRVVCIGDAVHPVSPYAAYGMGMAIEDGYFLAKNLGSGDLSDTRYLQKCFRDFENQRVEYVNHNVEFARKLGNVFHKMPFPLTAVRDFVYDHTPLLNTMIRKDYLAMQEAMCLSMKELHV